MTVLVTGAAGFIGMHVCQRLLDAGVSVLGLDNLSDYYDVDLKRARLALLQGQPGFEFIEQDVANRLATETLFAKSRFERVVHLAAQPGVRYSLENPHAYIDSNIVGFLNVLEGCRHNGVQHLVYASSSSVYGANARTPFSEHDGADHPLSLYGATKKCNEVMAHTYANLFGLPCTGLRFFTVYGPWSRPDMALLKFTHAIVEGRPIDVYNNGEMQRDFTYIDDIVEGVVRISEKPAKANPAWNGNQPDPASSAAPYRIYNIGNHKPEKLLRYIEVLEQALDKKAVKNLLPMQPGEVPATSANVDDLARDAGFAPETPIEVGIPRFVEWYRDYYRGKFA